MISSQLPPR